MKLKAFLDNVGDLIPSVHLTTQGSKSLNFAQK